MSYGILGNEKMQPAPVPPGSPPCDEHFPFDKNDPLMVAIRETASVREVERKRAQLSHSLRGIFDNELRIEIERTLGKGFAKNTLRNYRCDFQAFRAYCAAEQMPSLPSVPEAVASYIIHRAAQGIRPAAIERSVSAIRFTHLLHDQGGHRLSSHACNFDDPIVRAALRFIRKHCDPTEQPNGNPPDGKQPDGKPKEHENV